MSEMGKKYSKPNNYVGKRFGQLTVLKDSGQRVNKYIVWECQCDCGNIHYATTNSLRNGSVTHCSNCKIKSKGETKISELLNNNNIPFIMEKTFESCKNPETNTRLRFDFYVNDSYLIEYDGEQHFIPRGWEADNREEELQLVQARDACKNQWCKENNVPLIRIPYTQLNNLTIEDLKLETTKFLI